ncbi:MAG: hypothetical protein K2H10_07225, partial [Bacteroidales bacterium]|nr:hypothetical protein [Bacteroidales bacterium]
AHSFGIHVARMAGMPRQVVEAAERTLESLENGSLRNMVSASGMAMAEESGGIQEEQKGRKGTSRPHNVKEGRVESDGSIQLSFFQLEDPLLMSLRDDLNSADINNMTPLQAFDLLRAMKEKMGI